MNTKLLTMAFMFLAMTSIQAKTFVVKNPTTGQSMKVFCWNADSIKCKHKLAEAKERVQSASNPTSKTLSGARAADVGNDIKDNAVAAGNTVRDGVSSAGQAISDGADRAGKAISDGADRAGQAISNGASRVKGAVQSGYDSARSGLSEMSDDAKDTAGQVGDKVRSGYRAVAGKTYRVKIPGHGHSMTFHCRGGLESKECKEEKDIVVAAIKGGSKAESLEEFRLSPLYRAKDAVVETAVNAGDKVATTFNKWNHNACKTKLERHAKDFDEEYRQNGRQLVSYQEKLRFIEDKLVEEDKMVACRQHFDNAVLGYQLKWIQRGEVAQEKTHIFDGLGRLGDGDVGYWKSEEREGYSPRASSM